MEKVYSYAIIVSVIVLFIALMVIKSYTKGTVPFVYNTKRSYYENWFQRYCPR